MPISKLEKAYSREGAQLGRRNWDIHSDLPIKMYLQQVKLDAGGYDAGGAYWGLRLPKKITRDNTPPGALGKALHTYTVTMRLYRYENLEFDVQGFLEAEDREDAKHQIRKRYIKATFYT